MSERNAQSRLVNYYTEFAPSRFRKRNGEPVKLRTMQINQEIRPADNTHGVDFAHRSRCRR